MFRRLFRASGIAILALLAASLSMYSQSDVDSYELGKGARYNQTSDAAPILDGYRFQAGVERRTPNGDIEEVDLFTPLVSTGVPLSNDGAGNFSLTVDFASRSLMDSLLPGGNYRFDIETDDNDLSSTLALSGDLFPAQTPTLLNTGWSNGVLLIDPSRPVTFSWNSRTDGDPGDFTRLTLVSQTSGTTLTYEFNPNVDQRTIGANQIDPGAYRASLLFANVVTRDTNSIQGAQGNAFYFSETNFLIQAVPEPSTWALMLAGLAALALWLWRSPARPPGS